MGNSIIDQQRDNQFVVLSLYNGQRWIRNFITGENPPEFFIDKNGNNGNIETLFAEIQTMSGKDNRQIMK